MTEETLLEIQNLRVSYDKGKKQVIRGVGFTVEAGSLTALLGLNGSGKTTLLKAACGLIPCEADRRTVCGRPMEGMRERQRAAFVSYVPQKHSIIYHMTLEEAALMGVTPCLKWYETPSKAHRERAVRMLEYVGLRNKEKEDFLSLSEGQKQLVILARALVQDAPVMMFDEPDGALDYENRRRILEQIRQTVKEKRRGGLITLHDPASALRYCDRILLLQDGRIRDTILCRETEREEAEQKLRYLYPKLELIAYKDGFLTV